METGYITGWNEQRGFGFIRWDGHRDVFCHITAIHGNWMPCKDDRVMFDVSEDDLGRLRATNVILVPYSGEEL
ncbi:MAG: cold shock domain-containing protein [Blautia sp.]|nr:cold shock domain-containing protein [Blautia sp.]